MRLLQVHFDNIMEVNWPSDLVFVSVSWDLFLPAGVDMTGVDGGSSLDAELVRLPWRVSRRFLGTSLTLGCVWH